MVQREKELEREIEKLLAKADEADALEDKIYGKGKKEIRFPKNWHSEKRGSKKSKRRRSPWNR